MTSSPGLNVLEKAICKQARQQKNEFLATIASYRPDLFKYCRRLTNSPWDAEDLVQETLMLAYGRLADKHAGIQNVKAYLFKMATNQWITWCRRKKMSLDFEHDLAEPIYNDEMYVVQDSLGTLLNYLPPKERVALVLSDVFESKNEEIAEIMGNTEGAVKSALIRAREKLKSIKTNAAKPREKVGGTEQDMVLSLAVEAFNRRDLESFAKLFAVNAVGSASGCFLEMGAEEIKKGSLFYTINTFDGKPQATNFRAQRITFNDESFFAIFNGDQLDDLWKFTLEEDEIVRFDCYYCCPEVLQEVALTLNVESTNHGYWFEQHVGEV